MWGELLGIGFAGGFAILHLQWFGEPANLVEALGNLVWMLLAGAVEGTLLGHFQARVLSRLVPGLRRSAWIRVTMLAGVTGWLIGMIPTLFTTGIDATNTAPAEPPLWLMITLIVSGGLFLGGLFGLFQQRVLRFWVQRSQQWVLANALGWAAGLGWIFLAAMWPDENTPWFLIVPGAIVGGLLAGLTVGLVTGLFLRTLLPDDDDKISGED